jgi:signal transduction histidine kinase
MASVHDITERVRAATRLLQAQRMQAVGQLAGGIAHDFNNLLTTIIGFAELVRYELPTNDPVQDRLSRIVGAGQRAAYLVRQLLAFSRKQMIAPQVLNLNQILTNMQTTLQANLGDSIELTLNLAPGLWPIMMDTAQVEQLITSLVENARDDMPGGGILTINTENDALERDHFGGYPEVEPGGYVRIDVTDTGYGLNKDIQDRIFEPFFFTSEDVADGVGLRLAAAYGIVKQNAGYIWVDSQEGRGTTFKIHLPRVVTRETNQ